MKGPGVDEELELARKEFGEEFRVVRDQPYTLPHSPHERRLLVFARLRDPEPAQT